MVDDRGDLIMSKYVAFLRGINVGGNKKVPMAELKKVFEELGFTCVQTVLNTGNVLFEATDSDDLALKISVGLEKKFGFAISTIVFPFEAISEVVCSDPFKDVLVTPKTRLYVTFLAQPPTSSLPTPYISPDKSFRILRVENKMVFSVLDLALSGTVEVMKILEKEFGQDVTTRNWNTVCRLSRM